MLFTGSGVQGLVWTRVAGIFRTMETATVTSEGGQTVRLPKGFHIPTAIVGVRHEGETIVLEPLKGNTWPEGFFESIRVTDPTFIRPEQGQLPSVKEL